MKDNSVRETKIVSRKEVADGDGRRFAVVEIACDGFDYQPGQFVMVKRDGDYFQWSYPHLVLKKTSRGIKLLVSAGAKLYLAREDDPVILWGANGKGVNLTGATLVAEPATYFLMAPLASAMDGCQLVAVGGSVAPMDGEQLTVTQAAGAEAAAQLLAKEDGPVVMALNPPILQALMEKAPAGLKDKATVFASVEIGCGVDACKGCYLHSPDIRVGFPVCCEGPYLPYNRIDFETDGRCFQLFD